jgi:hypothetical protein
MLHGIPEKTREVEKQSLPASRCAGSVDETEGDGKKHRLLGCRSRHINKHASEPQGWRGVLARLELTIVVLRMLADQAG